MRSCEKHFIDDIKQILSTREREGIEEPPFPHAAVLVPLFEKNGDCHLLFTTRSDQVKHHKGEISFPGGVFDSEDGDLKTTALREAFEEIGLKEKDVQILGMLDDIVTTSEFIVTPFVALIPYPYPFRVSSIEIAELIEVPLSSLRDPHCSGDREIVKDGLKRISFTYQYGTHLIWGATARILKQFLELVSSPRSSSFLSNKRTG